MTPLSQRAQPRVKYPVDVRLLTPGEDRAFVREVSARSHNLSASGIFVEARQLVEVGTKVFCEIPLPGGTRRLAGMVARLQPLPFSSSGVGLGIRFVELDAGSETLLQSLVQQQQSPAHLVHARFEGMSESLRSQAVLTTDGVRLSAALPFLRPGSKVEIAFVSGRSRVLSHGVVRDAQIEPRGADGVPRLTVDVRLHKRGQELDPAAGEADDELDAEEVTAVDTPHALAAAVAARPIVHPTIEPARRSFDHAGRRPLRVHGRPRHARSRPAVEAEVTPAPATPRWMLQALKAGILITAGLALFVIGAAAARRATQAPATSPPALSQAAAAQVPGTSPQVPGTSPTAQVPGTSPTAAAQVPGTSPTAQVPGTSPQVPGTSPAAQVPGTSPTAAVQVPGTSVGDEAPPPAGLPKAFHLPWRRGGG